MLTQHFCIKTKRLLTTTICTVGNTTRLTPNKAISTGNALRPTRSQPIAPIICVPVMHATKKTTPLARMEPPNEHTRIRKALATAAATNIK